ncbi:MAG: hypothetical protein M3302_02105, partial [Actinomycetota bacterium]|nr:hypothetical protein [Actinomycetota bacterium]
RTTYQGPLRVSVYDQTHGLADLPGFRPRPPTLAPRHSDSDAVVVARTYQLSPKIGARRSSRGTSGS